MVSDAAQRSEDSNNDNYLSRWIANHLEIQACLLVFFSPSHEVLRRSRESSVETNRSEQWYSTTVRAGSTFD